MMTALGILFEVAAGLIVIVLAMPATINPADIGVLVWTINAAALFLGGLILISADAIRRTIRRSARVQQRAL